MPKLNNSEAPLPFPILMGDIGGTNARFSVLVDAYAEPKQFPNLHAADFKTIDDAIKQGVLDKTSVRPRSAVLAIAGPINGDEIPLTNSHWVVRPKTMISDLGFEDVLIINDFEAQALAVPVSGLPVLSMPSTPGFRYRAKAATSTLARAASATCRSGRISRPSKAGSRRNKSFAGVACRTFIMRSARSTASSRR
jgi:hypothetical protein